MTIYRITPLGQLTLQNLTESYEPRILARKLILNMLKSNTAYSEETIQESVFSHPIAIKYNIDKRTIAIVIRELANEGLISKLNII